MTSATTRTTPEQLYRLLADNATDVVTLHDLVGHYLYVSPSVQTLGGYAPEDIVGQSCWNFIHPDDVAPVQQEMGRAVLEGEFVTVEYRWRHAAGHWEWVETTARAVGQEIQCSTRGAGERRAAAAELSRRLAQQSAVARLGDRVMQRLDLDQIFDEAVRAVAETLEVDLVAIIEHLGESRATVRAGVGWNDGFVGSQLEMASLRADGRWAYEGAAVVIDDLRADNSIRARPLREHGVVSSVTVLIGSPEAPMGVLTANTRSERPFREHDVDFLQSVAHMLGGAIGRLRYEDRIRHDALHDALTGLPNRTLLLDRLGEALKRGRARERPRRGLLPRPRQLEGAQRLARPHCGRRAVARDPRGHRDRRPAPAAGGDGLRPRAGLPALAPAARGRARGAAPGRRLMQVALSEVLGALSYALDITEGEPPGHAVRTTAIGMRLGEQLGLGDEDRSALFYALLLKDAGCSSNAARLSSLFAADDHATKRAMKVTDWSKPTALARYTWQSVTPGGSPLAKARQMRTITQQEEVTRDLIGTRCERGAEIARMLELPEATQAAIRALDEHWDGAGQPLGLRGEEIPLLGRILCLAQTLEVFVRTVGLPGALAMALKRRGRWFDPALDRRAARDPRRPPLLGRRSRTRGPCPRSPPGSPPTACGRPVTTSSTAWRTPSRA